MQVVSGGGWWSAANLHLDAAVAAHTSGGSSSNGAGPPLLEFVITDGKDAWDKAPDGSNYRIAAPGNWRLRDGQLAPAATPPVLLVSDLGTSAAQARCEEADQRVRCLRTHPGVGERAGAKLKCAILAHPSPRLHSDDTLIGEDEATAAFKRWWEQEGVPAGGRLVYNTGRARDLFEQLLQVRGGGGDAGGALFSMLYRAAGTPLLAQLHGAWGVVRPRLAEGAACCGMRHAPAHAALPCHAALLPPYPAPRTRATCCRSQTC